MHRLQRAAALLALPLLLLLAALAPAQEEADEARPFEGQTVLVTGANRGLGLEFARQLSAGGAEVIGTARKPEEAEELRATGARVLQLDVTDPESVASLVKSLGDAPLDLLINNAGISGRNPEGGGLDFERVALVLDVNLIGPMRVTHALLPALERGAGKRVVNVSSRLGSVELNTSGGFNGYRESKAGLNMFSRSLAHELAPKGIRCIALSPGWVRTDMGGPEAPLSPEESIRGMLAVIAGVGEEESGRYYQWDGEELPW